MFSRVFENLLKYFNSGDIIPIENGGTGADNDVSARENLRLGDVATEDTVPITKGGTGKTKASDALAALGGVPLAGGTMTGDLTLPDNTLSANGMKVTGNVGHMSTAAEKVLTLSPSTGWIMYKTPLELLTDAGGKTITINPIIIGSINSLTTSWSIKDNNSTLVTIGDLRVCIIDFRIYTNSPAEYPADEFHTIANVATNGAFPSHVKGLLASQSVDGQRQTMCTLNTNGEIGLRVSSKISANLGSYYNISGIYIA